MQPAELDNISYSHGTEHDTATHKEHLWWGCRVYNSLSLRFNGLFPGEPGLAGVYWSKGWWKWWWHLELKSCKALVKASPPTYQHPVFLQAGCPSCHPTNNVKALKRKYHTPWTCLPQTQLEVFQLCSLTTISSWLPWGTVAMPLISHLAQPTV